jgi:ferredoxin
MFFFISLLSFLVVSYAYSWINPHARIFRQKNSSLNMNQPKIPLELAGKLDPTKTHEVKLICRGEEQIVTISEGESVLERAEKLFDLDSSCRTGVCTTCSGKVTTNIHPIHTVSIFILQI